MMENTYPFVKIPLGIEEIISWNPLLSNQPIKPPYPEITSFPEITFSAKPKQPELQELSYTVFRIPLIVAIVFSIYQCSANEHGNRSKSKFFSILTFTLIIGLIVLMIKISRQKSQLEFKFRQDQYNYQKAIQEGCNSNCRYAAIA
ncbi:MAG: hypothetical protein H7319_21970 [Spirosoma sp.]|nr:hypothetical protein [Spirosoma sp.]